VVVGAGRIGSRRALQLASAGAEVVVVDPTPTAAIVEAAGGGRLLLLDGIDADLGSLLTGAFLVVAATGDGAVNEQVAAAATEAGALVSRVDDSTSSDVTWMARADSGPLRVAVSTGGEAPGVSAWAAAGIEEGLTGLLGADEATLAALVELVAEVRAEWRDTMSDETEQGVGTVEGDGRAAPLPVQALDWRSAIDRTMLDLISRGRMAEAKERLQACRSSS